MMAHNRRLAETWPLGGRSGSEAPLVKFKAEDCVKSYVATHCHNFLAHHWKDGTLKLYEPDYGVPNKSKKAKVAKLTLQGYAHYGATQAT